MAIDYRQVQTCATSLVDALSLADFRFSEAFKPLHWWENRDRYAPAGRLLVTSLSNSTIRRAAFKPVGSSDVQVHRLPVLPLVQLTEPLRHEPTEKDAEHKHDKNASLPLETTSWVVVDRMRRLYHWIVDWQPVVAFDDEAFRMCTISYTGVEARLKELNIESLGSLLFHGYPDIFGKFKQMFDEMERHGKGYITSLEKQLEQTRVHLARTAQLKCVIPVPVG